MILSNREILTAIERGHINIDPLAGNDPFKAPFNTTAVDLRLAPKLSIFQGGAFSIDLRKPGIAKLLTDNSEHQEITGNLAYTLPPHVLVLSQS